MKGVVAAYAHDDRVLGWDLWNEPHEDVNDTMHATGKPGAVASLLPQVFDWARSVDPDQPITSGVFTGGEPRRDRAYPADPVGCDQLP